MAQFIGKLAVLIFGLIVYVGGVLFLIWFLDLPRAYPDDIPSGIAVGLATWPIWPLLLWMFFEDD